VEVSSVYQILLIEDDQDIRHIITQYFHKRDMNVVEASDGYTGLEKMNEQIDLVLLDIMMNGIDGYEVCFQIRLKYQCPIIFISALGEEESQLKAFEYGGDDFIAKPFLPSVLYAKCLAMCKRQSQVQKDIQTFHHLTIDYTNHQVYLDSYEMILTHKEYLLLEYFTKNAYQLLSREQILNALWGYDYYGDGRAVDTYVKKLRKKLGIYQYYIQTVFKEGYTFKDGENNET
jgi:Response regulators consisting of a CheY-like receiver domain and a winged-helix DNA-binding domain